MTNSPEIELSSVAGFTSTPKCLAILKTSILFGVLIFNSDKILNVFSSIFL